MRWFFRQVDIAKVLRKHLCCIDPSSRTVSCNQFILGENGTLCSDGGDGMRQFNTILDSKLTLTKANLQVFVFI